MRRVSRMQLLLILRDWRCILAPHSHSHETIVFENGKRVPSSQEPSPFQLGEGEGPLYSGLSGPVVIAR